ncbi:MAG: SGNH/GDSL hydrolase family protein [Pseudomonadota bacterium]
MVPVVKSLLTLFGVVFLSNSVNAATNYQGLWILGDSYSDRRNAHISSMGFVVPAADGYDDGRWSNGPMWVEHLASHLGLPEPAPGFNTNFSAGNNLAVGGAKTGTGNSLGPAWDNTGMLAQLNNGFLPFYSNPATNGDDLFVIFGGGNDSQDWNPLDASSLNNVVSNAMSNLDGIVRSLYNVGARSFMMPNLPGYSVFGTVNPQPNLTTEYADAFNPAHAAMVASLRNDLNDIVIYEVDFESLFDEIVDDPTSFGLSNVSAPCLDYSAGFVLQSACGNPEDYLLFDTVHPTAAAHQFMGDAAIASLQPIPVPGVAPLMAIFAIGMAHYRRGRVRLV